MILSIPNTISNAVSVPKAIHNLWIGQPFQHQQLHS